MQTDMSNAVKKQTQGHTSLPRYDIPRPPPPQCPTTPSPHSPRWRSPVLHCRPKGPTGIVRGQTRIASHCLCRSGHPGVGEHDAEHERTRRRLPVDCCTHSAGLLRPLHQNLQGFVLATTSGAHWSSSLSERSWWTRML